MAGRFSVEAMFKLSDRMSRPVGLIERRINRMTKSASSGLRSLDKAFGTANGVLTKFGLGVGAAAVAAGYGMMRFVQAGNAVEDSLAKVASVVTPMSGTVADASARMREAALDWSKGHHDSAVQFLDSTYMMISAGLNEVAAVEATRTAMLVATATMGDAAEAAALVATLYNNMGDKTRDVATEMKRLGDVVTATQQRFQLKNLNQLNEGLKYAIPTALQYNQTLEQTAAVIGRLNTAGLTGSLAGTAYTNAMTQMSKASRALGFTVAKTANGGVDFAGTIANLEKKFGSVAKMSDKTREKFQKAFGVEGFRAIALLIGKSKELRDDLAGVTGQTDAAAKAAALIESKGSKRWQVFANKVEALKIAIGDALAPAINKVIDQVSAWVNANDKLVANEAKLWLEALVKLLPDAGNGIKSLGDGVLALSRSLRENLSTIVLWAERGAKLTAGFYALWAATKVVRGGMMLFRGTLLAVTTAQRLFGAATVASTGAQKVAAAANADYAAALAQWSGAAQTAGAMSLRATLNASKLGMAVNGVTSVMGKAGLLGAALGVGYAIGTWLDNATGFSDWVADMAGKMPRRARRGAPGRDEEQEFADGTVIKNGKIIKKGTDWERHVPIRHAEPPRPQVVPPEQAVRKSIEESSTTTTTKDELGITIKDQSGKAEVTKKPKLRVDLKLQRSGAF